MLVVALFFLYSGQVFFAFLVFAALAVALVVESTGSQPPAQHHHAASGLGGTEKKAFGGEHELGYRFGLFLNFFGQLFGFFWNSFGKEPKKKEEPPKIVVEMKK